MSFATKLLILFYFKKYLQRMKNLPMRKKIELDLEEL